MTQREAAFKELANALSEMGLDMGPGQIDLFYLGDARDFYGYRNSDARQRLVDGLAECFDYRKLRNLTVAQINGLSKALQAAYSLGIQGVYRPRDRDHT